MIPESSALAALLVAGHALGDFVFQSESLILRKTRLSGIIVHGIIVAACHAAMIAPFLSGQTVVAIVAIAIAHCLIDAAKIAIASGSPSRGSFYLDQLAHLAVIAVAWLLLTRHPGVTSLLPPTSTLLLFHIGVLVSAYAFNAGGVSAIVVMELSALKIAGDAGEPAVGRVIGVLERWLVLTLAILGHWETLGLLVAAKSIARFKDKPAAEYFIVGTLLSLLGAVVTAIVVKALLSHP
jgi:hypothetical protein